jgi:hypothetical protein
MRSLLLATALLFSLAECLESSTGPEGSGPARIRLHVTGGFAGVDYTIYMDGPGGVVVGESCVAYCDFQDGDVLQTLSRDQAVYLTGLFLEAGIHSLDGTDFGYECCDQFHYELIFRDGDGTSTVRGSSQVFPGDLRNAVGQIHGLASGTLPVVFDPNTSPDLWPRDNLSLQRLEVRGDQLELRVSYSGGCELHDLKAVAWGGWMESFPVRIRAFISHDSRADPCDAIVTREVRFDLRPLQTAYQEAYGTGVPGKTTLIIELANPDWASSLSGYELVYVF